MARGIERLRLDPNLLETRPNVILAQIFEIDAEALPQAIERVRERLTADLRVIRTEGEPAAERFNAEIVSIATAAKALGERIAKAIPDALTASAVPGTVARSWSYDPMLLVTTDNLANTVDMLLHFSEHVRQVEFNRRPETVAQRAEMQRLNEDAQAYRLSVIDAENAYRATTDGRLLWEIIAAQIEATLKMLRDGQQIIDGAGFRTRMDDTWYRAVCEFAGLEFRPGYLNIDW